ncbi:hypothetical protein HDU79_003623 [Rhizoclosmatium sp. JEL0117]|nr:hypothetical protein HDU79_003623 [Rhizoclosmatium sp. JEL0117]
MSTPALFAFHSLPAQLRIGEAMTSSPAPWVDLIVGADGGVEATGSVVVELVGLARVALAEGRVDTEEVFATVSQKLAEPQNLGKGSHTFSLSIRVPSNLSPSFTYVAVDRSEIYGIRYVIRARLPLQDNKAIVADHPIVLTSPKMIAASMDPIRFLEQVGSVYGSVLSVQARRNMFLPLQPVTLLYSHQAPPNTPVKATYMELVQKAVYPSQSGSRRVVERIIQSFELPPIHQGYGSTYTLQFQLPQLPPTVFLGPIDNAYFLRFAVTFPDGKFEMLGPIEFEVLPDVQQLIIPANYDEAVEMLEGMGGINVGPVVRPRLLTLTPWIPHSPGLAPSSQPQRMGSGPLPQQHQQQRIPNAGYLAPLMMPPSPVTLGTPTLLTPSQQPWASPVHPVPNVTPESLQIQIQMEQELRQNEEARLELERVRIETSRGRELREEEERRAAEEHERFMQQQREELEQLRREVAKMKSSSNLRTSSAAVPITPAISEPVEEIRPIVSSAPTQSAPPVISAPILSPPPVYPRPPNHPPSDYSAAPRPMTTSVSNLPIVTSPVALPAKLQEVSPPPPPLRNPALETHHYPPPPSLSDSAPPIKPLNLDPPSTIPSPAISPQPAPKRRWWFSKSAAPTQPTSSASSTTSRNSTPPSPNNGEDLVNQICESAATDYRQSIKRNYKVLMGARERSVHKQRILRGAREVLQGVIRDPKDMQSLIVSLETEFSQIDSQVLAIFEQDKKDELKLQIRNLRKALQAAIDAQAIIDDDDLQSQCGSVMKPLREELKGSIFYAGMGPEEGRMLEELANRIWGDCIRVFEAEVKTPLGNALKAKAKPSRTSSPPAPAPSGSSSSAPATGTWGGRIGLMKSSSLPREPEPVCLRPECGKKKVGYGQSKLFCSVKCESMMIQEQKKAMSEH